MGTNMCYKTTNLAVTLLLILCAINSSEGSDRRTKYGCEGTTVDIECEEGRVINLVRAIVSIVICAVTVTATFIIFRRFSKGSLSCSSASVPCLEPGENGSPGYYPYLSSSATSTTITASTPDKVAASHSQYFLNNECQVLRPLMIAPIGLSQLALEGATASWTPCLSVIFKEALVIIPIGPSIVPNHDLNFQEGLYKEEFYP